MDVKYVREWVPKKGWLRGGRPTIDLALIGAEVDRLYRAGQVDSIILDPYQMHGQLVEWERSGIRVKELSQGSGRVESDTALYNAVVSRQIRHYGDPVLTQAVNNCATLESVRGMRISKRSSAMKIDAAVAAAMSVYGSEEVKRYGGCGIEVVPSPFDF